MNDLIFKKVSSQQVTRNNSSVNQFGPQLSKEKPLQACRKIKKLIHYDCKVTNENNDEVPDEDEVYIKSNLLKKEENLPTE